METENKIKLKILDQDEYLIPYQSRIYERIQLFNQSLLEIETNEKSIEEFAFSYKTLGLHKNNDNSLSFKEYAPGALEISIVSLYLIYNSLEILIFGIERSLNV